MTVPFTCVAIAFVLIYVPRIFVAIAQTRQPEGMDNKNPRDQQARLTGWGRRANAAHANTFEAFAPFAAAVLVAHAANADPHWSSILALTFVGARVIYPVLYIANIDKLRTVVWSVGLFATAGLFVVAWLR
jgi:uncharacterized MAPEG superfamily protein